MSLKEAIEDISQTIAQIRSILDTSEPFSALEQIAGEVLKMTKKTETRDALYTFNQTLTPLRLYSGFLTSGRKEELMSSIDYLERADISNEFTELKGSKMKVSRLIVEKTYDLITQEDEYRKLMRLFDEFKTIYVDAYVKQHEMEKRAIEEFEETVAKDPSIKIVRTLKEINSKTFSGVAQSLEDKAKLLSKQVCRKEERSVRDQLEFSPFCVCGFRLETLSVGTKVAQEKIITDLQREVRSSLRNLWELLETVILRFNDLASAGGMGVQASKLVEGLKKVSYEEAEPTKDDLISLLVLLEQLTPLLKETFEEPIGEKRKPIIKLSGILKELTAEVGDRITVRTFVEWIKRRHSEDEEIRVDVH